MTHSLQGSLVELTRVPPIFVYLKTYLFVFGVITIAGGVLGFVKAKSRASLIAGSFSGLLLLLAGWLTGSGAGPGAIRAGIFLALGVSAALLARFGMAFKKTKKVMPAGLITLLALGGIALAVAALLQWQA
jgi:uncharacterized membrane protein (UPF0136 family)